MFNYVYVASFSSAYSALLNVIMFSMLSLWSIIIIISEYERGAIFFIKVHIGL